VNEALTGVLSREQGMFGLFSIWRRRKRLQIVGILTPNFATSAN